MQRIHLHPHFLVEFYEITKYRMDYVKVLTNIGLNGNYMSPILDLVIQNFA